MRILFDLIKAHSVRYYLLITALYFVSLFVLPYGYWNYAPVFYVFLGPVPFYAVFYKVGMQLSEYTAKTHPDLMRKYAIPYGFFAFEQLSILSVMQNKEAFYQPNDAVLRTQVDLYIRLYTYFLLSFFTVLLVAIRILIC